MNDKKFRTRIKHLILLTIKKSSDPYFSGKPAEVAFFVLLALVPVAILITQLLGGFTAVLGMVTNLISEYVNVEIASEIKKWIDYSYSLPVSIALIILALWASSKVQFTLSKISNYAFTGTISGKGFIRERIRAMLTIAIVVITLVVALYTLVYGKIILELATAYINDFLNFKFEYNNIWYMIRWPMAYGVFFFMVIATYYVLPSKKVSPKDLLPGSIFSSIGLLIATLLFSYYTSYSKI